MKKTLVAIAALATVGAAFAQSAVTLYGKIDAAVGQVSQTQNGVNTAAGNVGTQIGGSGLALQNQRWGMKGTEDLGGGMSAMFQVENGFSVDTGAAGQGGLLFGRTAWVGLSGPFGSITAGRQYGMMDNYSAYDAQYGNNVSAVGYAHHGGPAAGLLATATAANVNGGAHNDQTRYNNTVIYTTPKMSGFVANVMYGPGEANKPDGSKGGTYFGVTADYKNGPMGVQYNYEQLDGTGTATVSNGNISAWQVQGSYDLQVVKLHAVYEQGKSSASGIMPIPLSAAAGAIVPNATDKGWGIGITVPVGALTFTASYAVEDQSAVNMATGQVSAYSALARYALSKRSSIYAGFLNGQDRPSAATAAASNALKIKNESYIAGFQHNF